MRILWTAEPHALTAKEVQERLAPDHEIAYTTALTVLVRLWQKGRLTRRRVGRAYEYAPSMSWAEYEAGRMAQILESVEDRTQTLTRFVETLSDGERARLRELIADQ